MAQFQSNASGLGSERQVESEGNMNGPPVAIAPALVPVTAT